MLGLMRWIDLPLRWKLLGSFGLVLLVLVSLNTVAYQTAAVNQAATDWVTHTLETVGTANATLADVLDMESGIRGFLLSGQDEFLTSYDEGLVEYRAHIAGLQALTADNPSQQA